MPNEEITEDPFQDLEKASFAMVKHACLSDCENFLGITDKKALGSIEYFLMCAYKAGKKDAEEENKNQK